MSAKQKATRKKLDAQALIVEDAGSTYKIKQKHGISEVYVIGKTEGQKKAIHTILDHDVSVLYGVPGSGKTHLSVGMGLNALLQGKVERLFLTRPYVEAGEHLGYLPGGMNNKIAPFMYPVMDICSRFIGNPATMALIEAGNIAIMPLAYMRGVTFNKTFVVADECMAGNTVLSAKIDGKTKKLFLSQVDKYLKKGKTVEVLGYNENTNKPEYHKVLHFFNSGKKETYKIQLNNRSVPMIATGNHPFAVFESGEMKWKNCEDLVVGDVVMRRKIGKHNSNFVKKENYDMILGWMLGDGSIGRNRSEQTSYRISKTHGLHQEEYSNWCMGVIGGNYRKSLKSGYTGKPLCGFVSNSMSLDQKFVSSFWNGKKYLTPEIEKYFTKRTLALWFMDDGSTNYTSTSCYSRIHSEGFSFEENSILVNILKSKFDLDAKIISSKQKYFYLEFNKENTEKLHNLLKSHIHPNLLYKSKDAGEFDSSIYEYKICNDVTESRIVSIEKSETMDVFNIEVEQVNNYFANKVLVHNCQNMTISQMHMLFTRIGEGSKLVITGDTEQSDLYSRDGAKNGLLDCVSRLRTVEEIGFHELLEEDCVRSALVAKIDKMYRGKK
jgi:phosphate starvation-inducible protein PhoH